MSRKVMSIAEALRQYGQHKDSCGWYKHRKIEECKCGIAVMIHKCESDHSIDRRATVKKYCDPCGGEYGSHHDECRIHNLHDQDARCDCGYRAALNGWPWDVELWQKKLRHGVYGELSKVTEVMDLDEAFDRYGRHLDWCDVRHRAKRGNGRYDFGACDCGFEALVNGLPWNPTYWRVKLELLEPHGKLDELMYGYLIEGWPRPGCPCERPAYDSMMAKLKKAAAARKILEKITPRLLKRYGQHDDGCLSYEIPRGRCDCGLQAAIDRKPWNEARWARAVEKRSGDGLWDRERSY